MFWTISDTVDSKCSYFENKIVILVDIDVPSMKV